MSPLTAPLVAIGDTDYMVWRALWHNAKLFGQQLASHAALHRRFPDIVIGDDVLLYGADDITIGKNCFLDRGVILRGRGGISIGSNVHVGAGATITAPAVIEDRAIICSGATIESGTRIGHHAMIGAGAVVLRDIPAYALAVGIPAAPIRYTARTGSSDLTRAESCKLH